MLNLIKKTFLILFLVLLFFVTAIVFWQSNAEKVWASEPTLHFITVPVDTTTITVYEPITLSWTITPLDVGLRGEKICELTFSSDLLEEALPEMCIKMTEGRLRCEQRGRITFTPIRGGHADFRMICAHPEKTLVSELKVNILEIERFYAFYVGDEPIVGQPIGLRWEVKGIKEEEERHCTIMFAAGMLDFIEESPHPEEACILADINRLECKLEGRVKFKVKSLGRASFIIYCMCPDTGKEITALQDVIIERQPERKRQYYCKERPNTGWPPSRCLGLNTCDGTIGTRTTCIRYSRQPIRCHPSTYPCEFIGYVYIDPDLDPDLWVVNGVWGDPWGLEGIREALERMIDWARGLAPLLGAAMIAIAGMMFMFSAGQPQGIAKARSALLAAGIGIIIIAGADDIVRWFVNIFHEPPAEEQREDPLPEDPLPEPILGLRVFILPEGVHTNETAVVRWRAENTLDVSHPCIFESSNLFVEDIPEHPCKFVGEEVRCQSEHMVSAGTRAIRISPINPEDGSITMTCEGPEGTTITVTETLSYFGEGVTPLRIFIHVHPDPMIINEKRVFGWTSGGTVGNYPCSFETDNIEMHIPRGICLEGKRKCRAAYIRLEYPYAVTISLIDQRDGSITMRCQGPGETYVKEKRVIPFREE